MIRQMLTGADNCTFDVARILWLQSVQVYMLLTFYAIYQGHYVFDPLIWGSGLAAIAGGYGASLYAKAGTEPQPSEITVQHGNTTYHQRTGPDSPVVDPTISIPPAPPT